ncbi:hypothetical protein BJP62_11850 [Jeongeupia sp. USM3]|nr:hypothetical protein BJP62_11850 [Jeongeupia sp. USM3]
MLLFFAHTDPEMSTKYTTIIANSLFGIEYDLRNSFCLLDALIQSIFKSIQSHRNFFYCNISNIVS